MWRGAEKAEQRRGGWQKVWPCRKPCCVVCKHLFVISGVEMRGEKKKKKPLRHRCSSNILMIYKMLLVIWKLLLMTCEIWELLGTCK